MLRRRTGAPAARSADAAIAVLRLVTPVFVQLLPSHGTTSRAAEGVR